jgi:hypothetical protein
MVNCILWHLGTLSSTIVKGMGILTSDGYVPQAGASNNDVLWVYAEAFDDDWEMKSNRLLPAVAFTKSPWQNLLPPDPGEDGTCAVVLEKFPESKAIFYPDHPKIRYCYAFATKDRLSSAYYKYGASNPSDWSTEVFADPWRTYAVVVTLPTDTWGNTFITEFGDYGTHILLYRGTETGTMEGEGVWDTDNEPFIQAVAIAASMTYTDAGVDADPLIGQVSVPSVREEAFDYASPARYVATVGRRVAGGCLDYDALNQVWKRKTAIEISTYEKPWAFPTTSDQNSPSSQGGELDNYAQTGSELRGLLGRDDHWVVFLDNEVFVLLGDSPSTWNPVRRGPVGCKSNRSVADCGVAVIWHAGDHFYRMDAGMPVQISEGIIDSTLIDWDSAHSARYAAQRYRFHCKYDGEWSVLTYHVEKRSWRIRPSDGYELVGICAPDASGDVYGVTPDGHAVSLFSADEDYGADSTLREAKTGHMVVAPPNVDVHIPASAFEIICEDANLVTLAVTIDTYGKKRQSQSRELLVNNAATSYIVKWDGISGNAAAVGISCTDPRCPEIDFLGVDIGEMQVA